MIFDLISNMICDLISNMTLQMQNSVGPFMGCYPPHRLEVWLGNGRSKFLRFLKSFSKMRFYENLQTLAIISTRFLCLDQSCCTCILVQQTKTDTQWRKVNQQFLTKMPKKDEADKQFESNWERDLYEEMGQGGKFCFKTLHRGNKSRLHRLQQTLLMTSDQEMAFSKGAHYMSKCHLICQTIYMKPTHRNISWGRKFCRRQ